MEIMNQNDPRIKQAFDSLDITSGKLAELFEDYRPILNGERYITDEHLQKLIHVCDRTLQDYRSKGLLPYFKLTKKVLYRESDVEKMLEKAYIEAWR